MCKEEASTFTKYPGLGGWEKRKHWHGGAKATRDRSRNRVVSPALPASLPRNELPLRWERETNASPWPSLPAKLCPTQNWPLVRTWRLCALFGALLSHEKPAREEPGNHHFFHVTQFHRGALYSSHRSLSPHWCATVGCAHLPRSSSHSSFATSSARARTGISHSLYL